MRGHGARIAAAIAGALSLVAASGAHAESEAPKDSRDPAKFQQKRVTASDQYLAIPGLVAAISDNYRFSGLLQVDAGLDIADAKALTRAEQSNPLLRDVMRTAVADYVGNFYTPGTVPDPVQIKRKLQAAVDKVMGAKIAEVTLATVIVHKGQR